ncbi:exonuclease SbcD [Allocatelliglobosispora scoriae]|uniref:Nuclease SbcCD subunit D n=1 Tax=Allocatelliglobosispora scoriae TaxID=643052 RepID=A0A841C010_9ACTN|nr:exonuclease SbcCD subunit D [Allocatelliglobosispora scoriae]MBB5872483.1 exonuclease SbcD [Allocatelliglobosispora scoriae]
MKLMHTSDWHVGKVLKGQARQEEQIAALAAVVAVARDEQPDLVIMAGDLYDNAAPSPDSQKIVTRALSALRATGAEVIVIAGNHDNGAALDALRSWADAAGITLRGRVSEKAADHIVSGVTAGGEAWRCIALPFLSQRFAVRALEMFEMTQAEAQSTYADHLQRLLTGIADEAFTDPDAINLITAHLTVVGGLVGGGEREAHTIMGYAVPSMVFPEQTHYVALGHLHRAQSLIGRCPVRYCGSPIAIDFGEVENTPSVTMVEVSARTAAVIREVPLPVGIGLRTVRGSLAQLAELETGDAWLRVVVSESPRAGLREEVQELLPRALEIRVDPAMLPTDRPSREARAERSPVDLFNDYLTQRGHADDATKALFEKLYSEVS